jgi:hypothetical protein
MKMKMIKHTISTEVVLTPEEAISICKIRDAKNKCVFLTNGFRGIQCLKKVYPDNGKIRRRLKEEKLIRGQGGWSGCPWK